MSNRSGSRVRRLLVLLAVLLAAFSATLVYVPERIPPAVLRTVREATSVDARTVLPFVGAAIAVVGLLSLWVWRAESRSERLADRDSENADREAVIAGQSLTAVFDQRRTGTGVNAVRDDGPLTNRLRDVLVDVYTHTRGGKAAAERHVDEGRWTTDRYAAAFVTADDTPDYPIYFRLFAWLYPGKAYEYRATRALGEVEAVCETELLRYEAPDRSEGWREQLWSVGANDGTDRSTHENAGGE
jgi:hypothetical protein